MAVNPDVTLVPSEEKISLLSNSPRETAELGAALASLLRAGDVLPLWGGFGAGKTTFVQGVARGLGVTRPVVSPSFGLVNEYPTAHAGGLVLHHLDLYRIGSVEEALAFGVEEVLGGDGVSLIEWPQVIAPILPRDRLDLAFEYVDDDRRRIDARATGDRSASLLTAWRDLLTLT